MDADARARAVGGGLWRDAGEQRAALPRPRRSRWALALPVVIGVAMLGLLGTSAGSVWRPVRDVEVVQAVFDAEGRVPSAPEVGAPHAQDHRRAGTAVQAAGWLEADPYVVAVAGLAEGVVREVLVLEGDRVEAGQTVARLVAEDAALALRAAEADVEAVRAALDAARAEAQAAETDWAEPVERDLAIAVAGAAVARAEGELAQWPAMVESERARLGEIAVRLERARLAFEGGGSTEIEVSVLEREHAAQAGVVEAELRREGVLLAELARARGELGAAERGAALRVRERRELDGRRAALAEAGASLRLAEARRDEAALRLARMDVVSPIAGVVQRRLVTPGQRLMLVSDDPDAPIVAMVYDPARLQVRVDVPLADAGGVVVGQECEVVVEILPGVALRGVVTRIGHEADIQKNTLEVKVRVIDPPELLRPEMLTRVRFLPGTGRDGAAGAGSGSGARAGARDAGGSVLLPRGVLEPQGSGSRVWVVRQREGERGVAEAASVEIIGEREGLALVRGAVHAGDMVITEPSGLREGMAVRIRMAGANAAAAEGRGVRP